MSSLSLHDLQGIGSFNNTIRVPTGHRLEVEGGFKLPSYPQASRPSNPEVGDLILNTTTLNVEVWTGGAWVNIGGGQSTLGTENNPATSAQELVNANITTDGVYWIKASGTAPLQQVYCILNPAVDGGGWMVISNNAAKGQVSTSGHIPRPTAYASYVGSNGWNSYDSNFNFSINATDMQFRDFYHVAYNTAANGFDPAQWFSYIGHRLNSTQQIPTNQQYWAYDSVGVGMVKGALNSGTGLGNRRLYYNTAGNYSNTNSTAYGFGVLPTTQITAEGGGSTQCRLYGSGGDFYPAFAEWWEITGSGTSAYAVSCFSFCDAAGSTGWDDWQDGSGMSDNWYVEGQSKNFGRNSPSFVMIR